jgi:hypothetical protein
LYTSPLCSLQENNDYFDKLKTKFSNYHDYSDYVKNDDFFYDCSHLNDTGAKMFSQKLLDDFFKN